MFVRGMRGLRDFVTTTNKIESWWKPSAPATVIPGVSNQTAAVVGGSALGIAALAGLAYYLWGRK